VRGLTDLINLSCRRSIGYLTARENEVELLITKFYNLHIVSIEKFHEESVCHKAINIYYGRPM